jgi:VWFA-related protein
MKVLRLVLPLAVCAAAMAQTPPASKTDQVEGADTKIVVSTINIVAPVLVTDRQGNIIDGLKPEQFHLFDNGKEQNIQVDVTYDPISLVVAMECSGRVESILKQMKHVGSLVPTVVGVQGEAALVKFDGRDPMLVQDFTSDPDKIKVAIDKINPGSSGSRMIDAVDMSVDLLRHRAPHNRKIILLISETRDEGSSTRLREALIKANLSNVLVYAVDITQLAVRLTQRQDDPGPVPGMDPTTMPPTPLGIPQTPTTMAQNYGPGNRAQFIPLLKEVYIEGKRIFVADPARQFAVQTGGQHFFFLKQKGLEDAVERISQELHSQYMITYHPNNVNEPGYHTIEVGVSREYICKTRPGYWLGGGAQQ